MMALGIKLESFPSCFIPSNYWRSWSTSSSSLPLPSHCPLSRCPPSAGKLSMSSPPNRSVQRRSESVSICTNPEGVDVAELSTLLAATRLNCEQFPAVLNDKSIVPVNLVKLRRALRHSTVVVALYVEGHQTFAESMGRLSEKLGGPPDLSWLDRTPQQSREQKTLVAFGRATSDYSLTASIYDLVVKSLFALNKYYSVEQVEA